MRKWNQIFNIFTTLMETRNCWYFNRNFTGTFRLNDGFGWRYIRLSCYLKAAWNIHVVIEIGSALALFSGYLMYFGRMERKVKLDPIKCTIIPDAFYISGYHWISLDSWGMLYLLRYHMFDHPICHICIDKCSTEINF